MNELQKLQFDILCKLDDVCRKNSLVYYLAYGTCIGAVRNKGFIPWDHDIDVLMPIDAARKLENLQNEFGDNYIVKSYRTDPNFNTISMRIVDKSHECVVKKNGRIIKKTYLSIDVYPFYNCPPTRIGLKIAILRSHIYKMLVGGVPQNHGIVMKLLSKAILILYPSKNRDRDIANFEKKMNFKGRSYEIADYYGLDISMFNAITYKKEWFAKPQELEFEGRIFWVPTDYDKYLTKRYGDYMTPTAPSEIANESVHELI